MMFRRVIQSSVFCYILRRVQIFSTGYSINKKRLVQMRGEERKRNRCDTECKEHLFALDMGQSEPSKYDVEVHFCPKYQREPLPPGHTFPQFNQDSKFYTPAFILGIDRRTIIKNEQQQLMDHRKQIKDLQDKHRKLWFPRPDTKHSLCTVCKEHYSYYYQHIASQRHQQKISLSPYNNHIRNLCLIYSDLWQGAQERADEQEGKKAAAEEEIKQKNEQQAYQEPKEFPDGQSEQQSEQPKQQRSSQENLNQLGKFSSLKARNKRETPDLFLYETPLKKMYLSHQSPFHAARARKERYYQRERCKITKGTQLYDFIADFKPKIGREDDIFLILEPIKAIKQPNQQVLKKQPETVPRKPKEVNTQKAKPVIIIDEESSKISKYEPKQLQKVSIEEKEAREVQNEVENLQRKESSVSNENEVLESRFDTFSRASKAEENNKKAAEKQPSTHKMESHPYWNTDPRTYAHPYPYPYPLMFPPSNQYFPKINSHQQAQYRKNVAERYKGVSYYNPYAYPIYDPQHQRMSQNASQPIQEKDKILQQRPYYPIPFPWPYFPQYYMPPIQPVHYSPHIEKPKPKSIHPQAKNEAEVPEKALVDKQKPNYSSFGNTSININFPMYMWPQSASKSSHYAQDDVNQAAGLPGHSLKTFDQQYYQARQDQGNAKFSSQGGKNYQGYHPYSWKNEPWTHYNIQRQN